MKSLKSAARSGLLVTITLASTLALGACSAGQITQTSDQVPAINGTNDDTADNILSVRDVTVIVDHNNPQHDALRFILTNQDPAKVPHRLTGATIDGQDVKFTSEIPAIGRNCVLYSDSEAGLAAAPKNNVAKQCIQRVSNTIENKDFAYAGHVPVTFTFDNGKTIKMDATINAPQIQSGTLDRDVHGGNDSQHSH